MTGLRPIVVDRSLRAAEVERRRRESLAAGAIDHAFHYHSARQATLWRAVHDAHAPTPRDPSIERGYRELFAETAALVRGEDVHVVALGPGAGEKERLLLDALRAAGCRVRYTPVDASVELALLSADVARGGVDHEIVPVAGDLGSMGALGAWLDRYPAGERRVYTAIGIVPNFTPAEIFGQLRALLRDGDLCAISANLAPVAGDESDAAYAAACAATLPQYDNPQTLEWLRAVLDDWAIAPALTPVRFDVRAVEGVLGLVATCAWREPPRAGAELRVFFSLRYTPARFERTLEAYGLRALAARVADSGEEGIWLAGAGDVRRGAAEGSA